MILRAVKTSLVSSVGLFYAILVLNNLTDYDSNFQFVRHVLMMDSTFPENRLMWRAINAPAIHTVFYCSIIAWESLTMLMLLWGAIRMAAALKKTTKEFLQAREIAIAALAMSLLMWMVAFLSVGGEWFLMWQSKNWNGQEAAFRMFATVGIVLLVLLQPDEITPS